MHGLNRGLISRVRTSYPRSLSLFATDPVPENKSKALPLFTLRDPDLGSLGWGTGKEESELMGEEVLESGTTPDDVDVDCVADGLDGGDETGNKEGNTGGTR
jgi:hypothetical protein